MAFAKAKSIEILTEEAIEFFSKSTTGEQQLSFETQVSAFNDMKEKQASEKETKSPCFFNVPLQSKPSHQDPEPTSDASHGGPKA